MGIARRPWALGILLALGLAALLVPWSLRAILGTLFQPGGAPYGLASPAQLVLEHLLLVGPSSIAAGVTGGSAAILVFAVSRRDLKPLFLVLGTVLQTLPPVAFLAILVPLLGFGGVPVFWALYAFGILPVFHGFLSALEAVDPAALEAARGLGLSPSQVLGKVRLPLALPGFVGGLKTSVLINLGTATIGAAMGAGGLGRPILAGIGQFNLAWLFQGAATVALLSLLILWGFELLDPPKSR